MRGLHELSECSQLSDEMPHLPSLPDTRNAHVRGRRSAHARRCAV